MSTILRCRGHQIYAVIHLTVALATACHGSEGARGTLMTWASDPCATGGPDLDAPLVTDRPDFTEASSTVGQGVAQVEFGYTYTRDSSAGDRSEEHSWGEALLRVGVLADWLEFRVGLSHLTQQTLTDFAADEASGLDDLYLGFKIGLTPQSGFLPEMALIPQMTVPTGSSAIGSGEVLPGVNWIYGWELSETLSTAGSSQINRTIDEDGEAYLEYAQSWTVAASLTDRWGCYCEWFALVPHSASLARPENYANGGFTYLLSDNVQWDIRAGVGLNEAADNFFAGTGLSIRFH